jgi:hypothetical protein
MYWVSDIMKIPMNKIASDVVAFGFVCLLSSSVCAQSVAPKPDLASSDWTVKSAHSLASNPPAANIVQAFVNSAFGNDFGQLCQFRFADLRHSGNLSLVVVIDSGGTGGCKGIDVFDKTASGFEDYSTNANSEDNLRDSIQDINHDGNFELVLYGPLAPSVMRLLGCDAEWPMIFAWTGHGYSDVSSKYKKYYEEHIKSLKKQIAANSLGTEEAEAPSTGRTPPPQPAMIPVPADGALSSSANSIPVGPYIVPAPAASASPAAESVSTPDPDYDCEKVEAAKTEAFLGIHSDATISDAVKASESNDLGKRAMAAVILSYLATPEAMTDLKVLAADSDPDVADIAKGRLSQQQDPDEYYRVMSQTPVFGENPAPYYLKLTERPSPKQ